MKVGMRRLKSNPSNGKSVSPGNTQSGRAEKYTAKTKDKKDRVNVLSTSA